MKAPRIIVSVTNDLYTDQRVHKVCTFLHEKGFRVLLVGRRLKNSKSLYERPYSTYRMRLVFTKGPLFYAAFNLRLFLFLLVRRSQVLLSNDLDTLLANYMAYSLKRKTKKLVYDSHELFTEVPELTQRPYVRSCWLAIEKWIFPKLKDVYTVNESIASIYRERYAVPVGVVRNVALSWRPGSSVSRSALGLPDDKKLIILQGAGINVDRGAEEAVEAMRYVENAVLYIVGSGDIIPQLKKRVKEDKMERSVRFIDRVPYDQMMNYTYCADVGLTLDKDSNPNYRYSLPNKVFDYIQAGTPVITSPIIEIVKIVEQYEVGSVIAAHEPKAIAESINALIQDSDRLRQCKENCIKARKIECWENEKNKLNAYFRL